MIGKNPRKLNCTHEKKYHLSGDRIDDNKVPGPSDTPSGEEVYRLYRYITVLYTWYREEIKHRSRTFKVYYISIRSKSTVTKIIIWTSYKMEYD